MKKPFIVAEVAQGYEGNDKLVNFYVKAAIAAGADAVKFQIFYADELALPGYQYYDLFKSLELDKKVWESAVKAAHGAKLDFYSDIFGLKSLAMLDRAGVDGFKIHSTDINNFNLIKAAAKTGKKVFLSTGGCELEEVEKAVRLLDKNELVLMYGFQAEPTQSEDNNLNRIKLLLSRFSRPVGFQDHSEGGSRLAYALPFVALGAGVSVIEKHLTLSRHAQIEDYISAMTPEEFGAWVKDIKEAYIALGKDDWSLTEKERTYRGKVRRAVCSARALKAGSVIKEEDIVLKRTAEADAIFDKSHVIGKKLKNMVKANMVITKENIL